MITYEGGGNVTIETIIITVPNILATIATDGIKTPNYVKLEEIKKNGQHLKLPKFKWHSQKTPKGNYRYIVLDSTYKNVRADTFYIKYSSNIFTEYQKSLQEGRYLFYVDMYEVVMNSEPLIDVKAYLITRSKNDTYSPTISRRNDFKIIKCYDPSSIKYYRRYTSVDYNQLLLLSYPSFLFEINNYELIGELSRTIQFEKLNYINEDFSVNLKQKEEGEGIFFEIPFREEHKNLEINVTINGKQFSPFPLDSITYSKTKDSLKISSPLYYIGSRWLFEEGDKKYIIIMFPLLKDELAFINIKFKYESKFILKKQDYFHYDFKYYLSFLPSLQNKCKIDISIPEGFHFDLDNSKNNYNKLLETSNNIVFTDINKPEYLGESINLRIIKDGATAFIVINYIIIVIFICTIIMIIFYYFTERRMTNSLIWAMSAIQFIIALITGWTSAENIIEILIYVDSYLLILSIVFLLIYKRFYKPPVHIFIQ